LRALPNYRAILRVVQTTVGSPVVSVAEALGAVTRYGNLPRIHDQVCALSGTRLDRSAYGLLHAVDTAGPLRLSELAQLLGVEPSTVSRQVKELARAGLLARASDPADGRAHHLALTAAGRRSLVRVRAARDQVAGAILAGWADEDVAVLAGLLSRLAADLAAYGEGLA